MLWGCPETNHSPKRSTRNTNGKYFDYETGEINQRTPCYFLRGLMPRGWTQFKTPIEYFREDLWDITDGKMLEYKGIKAQIYTDESRGKLYV